ncbi:MAG: hypothetical protein P1V35_13290 [Planctomycetota bacterium]|nr:hypothetical protein [Planctomycetota bacterium]
MKQRIQSKRAGFGLLELLITVGLFTGLLSLFSMSLRTSTENQRSSMDQAAAQMNAQKGLTAIREALGQTSFGGGLPAVYDGNTLGLDYPALAHPPANAFDNLPPSRELVFQTLEDADDNGWPDVDAAGNMSWSPTLAALIVTPDAQGINRIYLVDTAGGRRPLARNVGSLVIDDSASSGFQIPLDQLRVRLFMAPDANEAQAVTPLPFETRVHLAREEEALW